MKGRFWFAKELNCPVPIKHKPPKEAVTINRMMTLAVDENGKRKYVTNEAPSGLLTDDITNIRKRHLLKTYGKNVFKANHVQFPEEVKPKIKLRVFQRLVKSGFLKQLNQEDYRIQCFEEIPYSTSERAHEFMTTIAVKGKGYTLTEIGKHFGLSASVMRSAGKYMQRTYRVEYIKMYGRTKPICHYYIGE